MSPLNITQPLGIWSIIATIRWCPIFPKWDSYQPLMNHHEPKIYQNMGSEVSSRILRFATLFITNWRPCARLGVVIFGCSWWPRGPLCAFTGKKTDKFVWIPCVNHHYLHKEASKSSFSPSFLHHFPMGKSSFSPKKCHPKKWMTVVHLTLFLKKIPSFPLNFKR